jgi:hypothetical protein
MHHTLRRLFALAIAFAPGAAFAQAIDAKPGLWERTVVMQHAGMSGLPDFSKLPPEQRARLQPMIDQMQGKPVTMRECVTPETLQKWQEYAKGSGEDASCEHTVLESDPKHVRMSVSCKGGVRTGTMEWTAKTPELMEGRFDMVDRSDGSERKMTMTMTSRWLGAECGDVKP